MVVYAEIVLNNLRDEEGVVEGSADVDANRRGKGWRGRNWQVFRRSVEDNMAVGVDHTMRYQTRPMLLLNNCTARSVSESTRRIRD